jgi:hypothetical protein
MKTTDRMTGTEMCARAGFAWHLSRISRKGVRGEWDESRANRYSSIDCDWTFGYRPVCLRSPPFRRVGSSKRPRHVVWDAGKSGSGPIGGCPSVTSSAPLWKVGDHGCAEPQKRRLARCCFARARRRLSTSIASLDCTGARATPGAEKTRRIATLLPHKCYQAGTVAASRVKQVRPPT